MAKRPGAAAVAGGALLALLTQGIAAAQDGETFPREVTGGYASWTTDGARAALEGSGQPAWFPATGGGTNPETGDADIELGGTARLAPPSDATGEPLALAGLRLRLDGGTGALHVRTAVDGQARELALAVVKSGDAAPVVRTGGVTWSGLRASLTDEGAQLLSQWSGREFTPGDALGRFDVTVGTGTEAAPKPGTTPRPPAPSPAPEAEPAPAPATPSAAVAAAETTAGGQQEVTGAGFEPGEVVLVAIDEDTRYQMTADQQGRVAQAFPVYATATEGEHTVELYTVSGERSTAAQFSVRTGKP
ncbi:HtaA domain-containing protein [Streptomyces sp. NPDC050803]|uniref:HtaA domain-containing protein n=1 Tax=unclassified Streptomyces TaxID=2593676 RepID=UPI0034167ECA